jgi:hypothetical protein
MFFMAQISIHISIFLMYNYYAITIFLPWILHIHKLCQNFWTSIFQYFFTSLFYKIFNFL